MSKFHSKRTLQPSGKAEPACGWRGAEAWFNVVSFGSPRPTGAFVPALGAWEADPGENRELRGGGLVQPSQLGAAIGHEVIEFRRFVELTPKQQDLLRSFLHSDDTSLAALRWEKLIADQSGHAATFLAITNILSRTMLALDVVPRPTGREAIQKPPTPPGQEGKATAEGKKDEPAKPAAPPEKSQGPPADVEIDWGTSRKLNALELLQNVTDLDADRITGGLEKMGLLQWLDAGGHYLTETIGGKRESGRVATSQEADAQARRGTGHRASLLWQFDMLSYTAFISLASHNPFAFGFMPNRRAGHAPSAAAEFFRNYIADFGDPGFTVGFTVSDE